MLKHHLMSVLQSRSHEVELLFSEVNKLAYCKAQRSFSSLG